MARKQIQGKFRKPIVGTYFECYLKELKLQK